MSQIDRRRARLTVALLFGVNFLNYIDRYVIAAVLPLIQRDFHLVGPLPRLIPCQTVSRSLPITTTTPQEVAWFACALTHALLRLPVLEAILV